MTSKLTIALVALYLFCGSDAFVNSNHNSSAKTHFTEQKQPQPPVHMTSSTNLYMSGGSGGGNLLDRFTRVVKSNINKLVTSMENPERVIVQAVDDMQSDLVRIRQAYAEATATQRRFQNQQRQFEATAADWHTRAQLALNRQKEDLAREALSRRQVELDKAASLGQQLHVQEVATEKLYAAMQELELRIREASSKKEQLVARARTAKTTQQVNDMLSGLGAGRTSMDAFGRMEQKVQAMEVAAEVSAEMSLLTPTKTQNSVEVEFRMLEASSEVEDELARMKADYRLLQAGSELGDDTRVSTPVDHEREKVYLH